MPTRRNPVVRYGALLRKGGAHTKSVSGERHQSRRQLDDEIDDYYQQRVNSPRKTKKERDDSAPSAIQKFPLTLLDPPVYSRHLR